jgi:hypothetical protein
MANYGGKINSYTAKVTSPNNSSSLVNSGMTLSGDFGVAFLYFVWEENQLGVNRKTADGAFEVYYRMEAWAPIIDLLRNEDSTGFFFRGTDNSAMIYTGKEPVGEEES